MNEFTAKKIGEALAFAEVGMETWKMGVAALTEVLGAERATGYIDACRMHAETLRKVAEDAGVSEITLAKAAKTGDKLRAMRDLYVGDEWHNAVELLEWSGFFEGAAVVHYALANGTAQALNNEALASVADEAINFHGEILDLATTELASVGQSRATEAK